MRISNPTFSTKDFEITHIGFLVSEEFIGSLLEEFVKIYSVDDVARTMLDEYKTPQRFWIDAIDTAEEYKEQITRE